MLLNKGNIGAISFASIESRPTRLALRQVSYTLNPYTKTCIKEAVVNRLLLGVVLAAAHLLTLEVLVEEVEGSLVGLGGAHDGEHALSSIIVWCLGDGDSGSRGLADLGDLASTTTDDASNHVGWNGDVLCLDLLSILIVSWDTASGTLTVRAAVEGTWGFLAKISSVSSAHHTSIVILTALRANALSTSLSADNWVVQDSASSALPVVDEALGDLPNSLLDTFWGTLNLDNALGRLWEHLLLGNHSDAGDILDVLDLKTLAANYRTHLVVGDKKLDG